MTDKTAPKIVFAPGCFDTFDGTQEELDELVAEINRLVESGELMEKSVPVDMENIDPELEQMLSEMLDQIDELEGEEYKRKLN